MGLNLFPFSIESLILTVGYIGLFLIIFAETGLFFGFFLPGDTLLTTAGILAQRGQLHIGILIPLLLVAAIAGDAVGYTIGRRAGPRLFVRQDARFFKQRYLRQAEAFFEKHGGKAIILARFVGILRTFAPPAAGAAGMHYPRFAVFNVVGGTLWVVSMLMLGYILGSAIPNLEVILIGAVFLVSVAPLAYHFAREWFSRRRSGEAS